jgi:histone H3/H4
LYGRVIIKIKIEFNSISIQTNTRDKEGSKRVNEMNDNKQQLNSDLVQKLIKNELEKEDKKISKIGLEVLTQLTVEYTKELVHRSINKAKEEALDNDEKIVLDNETILKLIPGLDDDF